MIRSFEHKGLEKFFTTGSKAGIQPKHAERLRRQLTVVDHAVGSVDMNLPGYGLHELKGKETGTWSVTVNGNWRLTFRFAGTDAILVDYRDYH